MTKKQSLQILKGENYDFQNSNGIENSKKNISDEALPNRLLSAIPISDLGESLDSRHLSESFNGNSKFGKGMDFFAPIYPLQFVYNYLAHLIEQPIFRIPNLEYLQRNFVYLLDQQ